MHILNWWCGFIIVVIIEDIGDKELLERFKELFALITFFYSALYYT